MFREIDVAKQVWEGHDNTKSYSQIGQIPNFYFMDILLSERALQL